MTRNQQDLARVSEEAALWVQRLMHDASAQTGVEFDKWIRQAPRHIEEFLIAQMMWEKLDRLDASFSPGTQTDGTELVIEFPRARAAELSAPQPRPHRRMSRWLVGMAASVLAGVATWLVAGKFPLGSDVFATAVGTQESIKLHDGSVVHLNTHSRIEVRFSDQQREVRLLEGEALFTVAHDAARPFLVTTDSARVRAVGTEFNVYRNSDATTRVSVLDGVVQVTSTAVGPAENAKIAPASSPAALVTKTAEAARAERVVRLAAGDQAEVERGQIVKIPTSDVQRAVAWRARRLIFQGDRVEDIAREFNRYNRVPIRIEGIALRERKMSGVFDADDPAPLIRFLSRDPKVEVVQGDDEIVFRPRATADH